MILEPIDSVGYGCRGVRLVTDMIVPTGPGTTTFRKPGLIGMQNRIVLLKFKLAKDLFFFRSRVRKKRERGIGMGRKNHSVKFNGISIPKMKLDMVDRAIDSFDRTI